MKKKTNDRVTFRVTFWYCAYCEANNITESSIIIGGDTFFCASCEVQYSTASREGL